MEMVQSKNTSLLVLAVFLCGIAFGGVATADEDLSADEVRAIVVGT
jgi:hypothetical protein